MKIIDRKPWTMPFTCEACGSKLEAERDDIVIRKKTSGWDEPACDIVCVDCPVCGAEFDMGNPQMLPRGIREDAYKRGKTNNGEK